jgi:hemolysin-activating ACP:hemolysin acyltransferase
MTFADPELNDDATGVLIKDFDQSQTGAALSKLVSGAIGDIVMVMSKSAEYKTRMLADIEWLVLPAVYAGQYYVSEVVQSGTGLRAPVACITWASVSDDAALKLSSTNAGDARPEPAEWASGTKLWLIDMVGDRAALASALQVLGETQFKDKDVFIRILQPDGTVATETLDYSSKRQTQ